MNGIKNFVTRGVTETKGYYFYNEAEGKVLISCNGVFFEKEFLSKGGVSGESGDSWPRVSAGHGLG
jgi:hypothetical protein